MRYKLTSIVAICLLVFASGQVAAQSLSVDDIVHRANKASYYEGQDGRAQVEMTITDDQGRERHRRMVILRKDMPETDALENGAYRGEQKFYIYFTRPADVNKMGFMVWKKLDADDERWLYLPALDLVKRIAASDKRTSFVGSDFFYEDVSGREINEDRHELIETTDSYYVIKNTPNDPSSVEFNYYKMYIHKDSFIPVQVEYFDAKDNSYRIAKALEVETIQGHPTVTKASMENLKTGSKTVMEYSDVEYDIGLPDDIFTERYLRKPPREYLR
jgi:outer membrane lipoprotein-sorting protein